MHTLRTLNSVNPAFRTIGSYEAGFGGIFHQILESSNLSRFRAYLENEFQNEGAYRAHKSTSFQKIRVSVTGSVYHSIHHFFSHSSLRYHFALQCLTKSFLFAQSQSRSSSIEILVSPSHLIFAAKAEIQFGNFPPIERKEPREREVLYVSISFQKFPEP